MPLHGSPVSPRLLLSAVLADSLLILALVFVLALPILFDAKPVSSFRYDLLSLSGVALFAVVARDQLSRSHEQSSLAELVSLVFLFLGLLGLLTCLMVAFAWEIYEIQSLGPGATQHRFLSTLTTSLFVVACLLLVARHVVRPALLAAIDRAGFLYFVSTRLAALVIPAVVLTFLSYWIFSYESSLPNHASVFAGFLAVALALRDILERFRSSKKASGDEA